MRPRMARVETHSSARVRIVLIAFWSLSFGLKGIVYCLSAHRRASEESEATTPSEGEASDVAGDGGRVRGRDKDRRGDQSAVDLSGVSEMLHARVGGVGGEGGRWRDEPSNSSWGDAPSTTSSRPHTAPAGLFFRSLRSWRGWLPIRVRANSWRVVGASNDPLTADLISPGLISLHTAQGQARLAR